jgi:hypothetical protein
MLVFASRMPGPLSELVIRSSAGVCILVMAVHLCVGANGPRR